MAVTLTENYRTIFSPVTVREIDRLQDEGCYIMDILEFIDEHGEDAFCDYYEQYVELGEQYNYAAVDYFINELESIDDLDNFEKAYVGWFQSPEDFAEDFFQHEVGRLDYRIVIDWEETAKYLAEDSDISVYDGEHYFRRYY